VYACYVECFVDFVRQLSIGGAWVTESLAGFTQEAVAVNAFCLSSGYVKKLLIEKTLGVWAGFLGGALDPYSPSTGCH